MKKCILLFVIFLSIQVSAQTSIDVKQTKYLDISEQYGEKVKMKVLKMGNNPDKQLYSIWLDIPNYKGCGGDPEAIVMFRFYDGSNVSYNDRATYDCAVNNISIVINPNDFTGKSIKDIVTSLTPDNIYKWRSWYRMEEILDYVKSI